MYSSDSQYPSVVWKWDYSLRYCYNHKQIIVELETEKEIAQKALKTMMKQRNEADALLAALSSTVDRGEALLDDIGEQMFNVECDLQSLQGGLEGQISNTRFRNRSETCDEIKPEIEEGQLELRRLLEQRKDISEQLDLHRDQLSPIRKVPPEIIRILFLLWASDRHFLRSPTYVSPNVLTGVSGRILHSWIERSGSSALSFSIEERDSFFRSSHARADQNPPIILYGNTNSEYLESPVASMLDLFIPHHFRWRKVRLRYNRALRGKVRLASLPMDTTYPLLEEVYLDESCYSWAQEDVDRIKSMMVFAPRLHSISWLSWESYRTLAFPWEQLTHFSLGLDISMSEGLGFLAICPHLKSLELRHLLPMYPVGNDDGLFVHNTLERLYLSTAGNLAALFDQVTLPALKDLSLSEADGVLPTALGMFCRWPQSQFLAFLLRSGCTIKQFIIQECDISAEEIAECLAYPQISKSLGSLSIREDHEKHLCVTDEVLRQLTYTPPVIYLEKVLGSGDDQLVENTPEVICPNLTTIKLWGCISAQDGKVADMVESRWLSRTELPHHATQDGGHRVFR
ncbi:uncharacterized protein LACBIDRAFT_335096 [Laccaria bicolor S238N-H82]|uniref:Predicted protein n=1 Tax=Laccaria bicolor (strain S238N-H82 / ATCC MYA-4686) TaxID=486041 RepID=B0E1C4_LACBS|nr:uncharacterized protein LACBIDRAFT_335096 [Laccaria bicolor S238N-H82]EDQ99342.1 predicted protein [Laccaria bicolor S238N-H82]|eukprot:XP_001889988.1 predicted protein [Laccaria bicolor S238N-H82]